MAKEVNGDFIPLINVMIGRWLGTWALVECQFGILLCRESMLIIMFLGMIFLAFINIFMCGMEHLVEVIMKKYVYYDTDIDGNEEYDIRGESYEILIRTCCRYSAVLYLKCMKPDLSVAVCLKPFEIQRPQNVPNDDWNHLPYCEKHYYKVCPELCEILLHAAGGIFEWLNGWGFENPDDPTFYRSDGTVFFTSEIHEGVCELVPRPDEDVQALLQAVNWLSGQDI